MKNETYSEGRVAKAIEQRTKMLPSDLFLWGALGSIGLALSLRLADREEDANFVGHWAPTLLILGLYNKMVKLQGSSGSRSSGSRSSMGRMMTHDGHRSPRRHAVAAGR